MKKGGIFLFSLLIIFLSFSVSASFTAGNPSHSIIKQYSPLDTISGWINISLNNEPPGYFFKTNFGGSITLVDLLNANPDYSFSCSPNCATGYSTVPNSGESIEDFALSGNQEQVLGFNLTGDPFGSVTGFFLNVTSNAAESNTPQLFIDLLDDGSIEWQAYNVSGNFGTANPGCYDNTATQDEFIIGAGDKYCETVILPVTNGVDLGAGINATTGGGGASQFKLTIDDQQGRKVSCFATANPSISTVQNIDCNISNFKITQQQTFLVCIENKTAAGSYKIHYEDAPPVCGTTKTGASHDFNLFAKPETYAPITNFPLNDAEITKSTGATGIESAINKYVNDNYNMNCSNGCIVPIRFISNISQELILSNLEVDYSSGGGTRNPVSVLYNLTTTNFTLNSGFGKLFLDSADFLVPNSTGTSTLILTLNDSSIFSDSINITNVPKVIAIDPNFTIAGYPTNFTAITNSVKANITGYEWDFGDGTSEISAGKSITHTYDSIDDFQVNISMLGKNSQILSTSFFTIEAGNPADTINQLLVQQINSLATTKQKIKTLPQFYQTSLNSILNITNFQAQIDDLVSRNDSASSDEEYIAVLQDLLNLRIPDTIKLTSDIESAPFYTDDSNINLDVLKTIGTNTLGTNEQDYIDAITAWNLENIDATMNLNDFSAVYSGSNEPVLSGMQINVSKNASLGYNPYLIIKKLDNMQFDKNYNQRSSGDYYYIELTRANTVVSFSTTEEINITEIPAFISPEIKQLPVLGPISEEQTANTTPLLILAFSILIVLAVIIYLLLKRWYKIKYENYLFKNKNDLYNLVSYIQNSKKAGASESSISEKLKKAGWKAEQVRYIMRKYSGKKTGL